jgi:hypothetical protein
LNEAEEAVKDGENWLSLDTLIAVMETHFEKSS